MRTSRNSPPEEHADACLPSSQESWRAACQDVLGAGSGLSTTLPAQANRGKYRLVETLDHGGMGTVYRALDTELNRFVAVKVLSLSDPDDTARKRFRREAKLLARLQHRHIVTIHELVGAPNEDPWLVMESLHGQSLADRIDSGGRLPPYEACTFIRQCLEALELVHARDIVHRDLKPANVFLHEDTPGAAPYAKILDFGIATLLAPIPGVEFKTEPGSLRHATPAYAAPEQLWGAPEDLRVDIYALGVTLYEALTEDCPFRRMGPRTFRVKVPRVDECVHGLPRRLGHVVERAMAPDAADRFASAREFAEALAPFAREAPKNRRRAVVHVLVGAALGLSGVAFLKQAPETTISDASRPPAPHLGDAPKAGDEQRAPSKELRDPASNAPSVSTPYGPSSAVLPPPAALTTPSGIGGVRPTAATRRPIIQVNKTTSKQGDAVTSNSVGHEAAPSVAAFTQLPRAVPGSERPTKDDGETGTEAQRAPLR